MKSFGACLLLLFAPCYLIAAAAAATRGEQQVVRGGSYGRPDTRHGFRVHSAFPSYVYNTRGLPRRLFFRKLTEIPPSKSTRTLVVRVGLNRLSKDDFGIFVTAFLNRNFTFRDFGDNSISRGVVKVFSDTTLFLDFFVVDDSMRYKIPLLLRETRIHLHRLHGQPTCKCGYVKRRKPIENFVQTRFPL